MTATITQTRCPSQTATAAHTTPSAAALRDIAFVLKMTQKVKHSMNAATPAATARPAPTRPVAVAV